MLSREEGRKQRREIKRQIDAEHVRAARQKIRDLREAVRIAKAVRATKLAEASARCRTERVELKSRLKEARRVALARIREEALNARRDARAQCSARKGEIRATGAERAKRAAATLAAERTYQADLRRIEQGNRAAKRAHRAATATERRSESDDEVRSNIPPELVRLFDRVRRGIKGSTRETRTEAFLRYAEEHPREVLDAIGDESERQIREYEARAAKLAKAVRRRSRFTPEELAAVPF